MENSRECPRRQVTPQVMAWLSLYSHYAAGHLYQAGGIADQPALFMAAMRLIDGAVKGLNDG